MNRTFSTRSNCCSYTGEHVRKITRDEVVNLRATGSFKPNYVVKMIKSAMREISSILSTPLAKKAKTQSMCKYYGHVIQDGPWKGYYPVCRDCGCEVSSPDMLRKAMPTK